MHYKYELQKLQLLCITNTEFSLMKIMCFDMQQEGKI